MSDATDMLAQASEPGLTPPTSSEERLGQMLIEKGILDAESLGQALTIQEESGERLGEILVAQQTITEKQLLIALGEQLSMEVVDLIDDKAIPDDLITAVPISF